MDAVQRRATTRGARQAAVAAGSHMVHGNIHPVARNASRLWRGDGVGGVDGVQPHGLLYNREVALGGPDAATFVSHGSAARFAVVIIISNNKNRNTDKNTRVNNNINKNSSIDDGWQARVLRVG